ncbi:MAG TPA: response regulator [Tepidisphaeraceae bacterium]
MSKTQPLIAVVDDEESVRRALRRLICSAGLDVEAFTSGDEFLGSLARRLPDCVILDLHMPQVSGFDVQARLTQQRRRLPVIVITGRDSDEVRQRALDGGAVAYLRKPVDDQTLLDAVAHALVDPVADGNPC